MTFWFGEDCPTCGAEPGDWCWTRSGRVTYRPHVARVRLAARFRPIRMVTVYLPGDGPKERSA